MRMNSVSRTNSSERFQWISSRRPRFNSAADEVCHNVESFNNGLARMVPMADLLGVARYAVE